VLEQRQDTRDTPATGRYAIGPTTRPERE
jgi:hypothetical protein